MKIITTIATYLGAILATSIFWWNVFFADCDTKEEYYRNYDGLNAIGKLIFIPSLLMTRNLPNEREER